MEESAALLALAALSHAHRLGIFRLLVQAGPEGMSAGRIAEQAGLAPSSLSFHIKELSRAGLVHQRQASRFIFYAANYEVMKGLVAFLTENCCGGNPCLPVAACSSTAALEKSR
jgi:DNA-binding transcriptional ArsR family regulator